MRNQNQNQRPQNNRMERGEGSGARPGAERRH